MARAQTPSVWLLSRDVKGVGGECYTQNVTVYAGSAGEAKALVSAEFARLARITGKVEPPYRDTPAWTVEQVRLDGAKVITLGITR
jgi:hypothetical protein